MYLWAFIWVDSQLCWARAAIEVSDDCACGPWMHAAGTALASSICHRRLVIIEPHSLGMHFGDKQGVGGLSFDWWYGRFRRGLCVCRRMTGQIQLLPATCHSLAATTWPSSILQSPRISSRVMPWFMQSLTFLPTREMPKRRAVSRSRSSSGKAICC